VPLPAPNSTPAAAPKPVIPDLELNFLRTPDDSIAGHKTKKPDQK
jgi:hypothetical protein